MESFLLLLEIRFYAAAMPLPVSPLQGRYTRQQIADATGIEGELLSYWIKEGLLIAAEGEGLGKGKHRRFGFEAIHIAAVLKELGRYGVQTAGLKHIASLLWRVVAFGSQHSDITETIALDAAALRRARARYPARASLVSGEDVSDTEYSCFEEWLECYPTLNSKAFEIEPWFDDAAELGIALYHELFTLNIFEQRDVRWMFFHADDALNVVPEDFVKGLVDLERMPSYLVINLSLIIRPIWML
jgi:DNA-binding transcriptional MerR regulator